MFSGLRVHWSMMLGFENILFYLAILSRENECQISQNYILHMKFLEFYLYNHNCCEIQHLFSWTSMKNFLWCYYRWFITSSALEKCKKECNVLWVILVQDFCPLKIKITQFPDGFRLKILVSVTLILTKL